MVQQVDSEDLQIGSRIQAKLRARRCTRRTLASRIGMSEWALGRRMLGRVPFRTPELREVAEVLDVPLSELLGEEGMDGEV
jgi:transcriptional regulator with XRE-family HTH domain